MLNWHYFLLYEFKFKHMKTIILSCLIALGLGACTATKIDTGTYRVASAQKAPGGNSVVTLEGFKKEFVFPTDTLKKGDLVNFVKLTNNVKPSNKKK